MATTSIFVNLPVNDVEASKAYYTELGYTVNPLFSDENAGCIVLSDALYIMVLSKPYFATFTDRELVDPTTHVQALHALGVDSKEEVDELAEKAAAAGGTAMEPQDLGFMYMRDIYDLDGHGWQLTWMDPAAAQNGPPSE